MSKWLADTAFVLSLLAFPDAATAGAPPSEVTRLPYRPLLSLISGENRFGRGVANFTFADAGWHLALSPAACRPPRSSEAPQTRYC